MADFLLDLNNSKLEKAIIYHNILKAVYQIN
jgi:hypothetical protein